MVNHETGYDRFTINVIGGTFSTENLLSDKYRPQNKRVILKNKKYTHKKIT